MSEKFYALLLRLFPSRFHQSYGEDALQLFRDRVRDESGFTPRLRLWLDLLSDLLISVPRQYFYAQPELLSAPADQSLAASPAFYILGKDRPRPGALAFGAVLSLSALLTFANLLQSGTHRPPFHFPASRGQRAAISPSPAAPSTASPQSASQLAGDATSAAFTSATNKSAACCAPSRQGSPVSSAIPIVESTQSAANSALPVSSASSQTESPSAPPSLPQPSSSRNSAASANASVAAATLDASQRHRVLTSAITALKQYYHSPAIAQQMSNALLSHEQRGDDNAATDGRSFAALLTQQMRDVSHDLHLDFVYSADPLPVVSPMQTSAPSAGYRDFLQHNHCTFEKIEVLPHNIGYLKFNSFPDLSVCRQTAAAAMARVNNANAIIFDLRDNRGGQPEMVAFLAAYLFDHPEYFYNPRENTTQNSWTHSPVPGSLLADKPVYILTSHSTLSGAEQFSYDLKMLKRATLIGETTGGAVHSGVFHRLDDHFGIGIPEVQPINPYSTSDWAETGVQPDINVPASAALQTAQKLAAAKLRQK
jgi:Peptidase family S41